MAALIAKIPEGPSARPDPATIAARLVKLLPRWVGSAAEPSGTARKDATTTKSRALLFVIAMVLVLAAYTFIQSGRAPAEQGSLSPSISGIISPPSRTGP